MKKKLLIFGLLILILGAVLFIIGLAALDFDFNKLNAGGPYVQRSYTTDKTVLSIIINDKNADITFIKTTNANFSITFDENEKEKYDVIEADGVLTVNSDYNYEWYDYIFNFNIHDKEVIVEVPSTFTGNVSVKTNNGSINIKDLDFNEMKLDTDNGPITLANINCGKVNGRTNNGTIKLDNVKTTKSVELRTDNGRIYFTDSECLTFSAINSNGRISLDNSHIIEDLYAKTSNGNIILDEIDFGGDASCLTSNGTISGTVVGKESDFYFKCKTSNGQCNLPNEFGVGSKVLTLKTSNGDIKVSFVEKAE